MSKKKKKNVDPWVAAVNGVFNRKRAKREYVIPKDYILSVSDAIWRTQPTKEIIYNTLAEFYSVAFERGYLRKGDDCLTFKTKQEKHLTEAFNQFMTELDDSIHEKSNNQQTK
jgi:hypothetical protein